MTQLAGLDQSSLPPAPLQMQGANSTLLKIPESLTVPPQALAITPVLVPISVLLNTPPTWFTKLDVFPEVRIVPSLLNVPLLTVDPSFRISPLTSTVPKLVKVAPSVILRTELTPPMLSVPVVSVKSEVRIGEWTSSGLPSMTIGSLPVGTPKGLQLTSWLQLPLVPPIQVFVFCAAV